MAVQVKGQTSDLTYLAWALAEFYSFPKTDLCIIPPLSTLDRKSDIENSNCSQVKPS